MLFRSSLEDLDKLAAKFYEKGYIRGGNLIGTNDDNETYSDAVKSGKGADWRPYQDDGQKELMASLMKLRPTLRNGPITEADTDDFYCYKFRPALEYLQRNGKLPSVGNLDYVIRQMEKGGKL